MEENRLDQTQDQGYSLCARIQERLPDLVEGYLDAMTAEAIRAHLSVCYFCAKLFGEMEQTVKLVETLPFAEPGKDFAPSIMTAIRSQSGHSFQAPVVEVETQKGIRVSRPQTTTGQQRPDPGTKTKRWLATLVASFALRPEFALSAPAAL
jgi:hypothetical protein